MASSPSPPTDTPQPRLAPPTAAILTFLAAGCVLVLEIAAGRLLAPYVGVSLTTYTGIIGVILAGIAIGAWVAGWAFQFVGHAIERKPPEFFKDWRFLLVGLRWWVAKMTGRA